MGKSQVFLYFCLSFILGIFFHSFFNLGHSLLVAFLISSIVLFVLYFFQGKTYFLVLGFCVLIFTLGTWHYQTKISGLNRPELTELYGQKVKQTGLIVQDPEIGMKNTKTEVFIPDLDAKILIYSDLYPKLEYGDKIRIKGKLQEPPEFEGFNYKDYLEKKQIYFLMSYPGIEVLEKNQGNILKTISIGFKNKIDKSLSKIVSYNLFGFFQALLFGDESNISSEWKEKLNITGTRHIAAVSGMNTTIISIMIMNFLLFLGFWRNQSFWISLVLIFFYILMIGAPASGVRAGIMAGLVLLSQYSGKISNPERLIVFAACIMLILNPLLLKHDIGFQLSFLAILGLVYLNPLFSKAFKKIPNILELRTNLSSTLAAQIFVLPVLIFNFGQVSLLSPLVNILILPFIPLLTIGGFGIGFLGLIWSKLGLIISLPFQVIMGFIVWIINVFSKISWVSVQIQVSGVFVFVCYFFLIFLVYYLRKNKGKEFLE